MEKDPFTLLDELYKKINAVMRWVLPIALIILTGMVYWAEGGEVAWLLGKFFLMIFCLYKVADELMSRVKYF